MRLSTMLTAAAVALFLVACGGHDDTGGLAALVRVDTEAAGPNCAAGGIKINGGLDDDSDGTLDVGEIGSQRYVCKGSGANPLAAVASEPAGVHCATGGKYVSIGLDGDASGALDAAEVTTVSYYCNGDAASNGGLGGPNGTNNLVSVTALAVNDAQCTYGGSRQDAGYDNNRNGALDPWEILATTTTCTGAPGLSIWTARETPRAWQSVASSSDGSKLIAAVTNGPLYLSADSGVSWTVREVARNWTGVASSADGTKLVAVEDNGQIHTSTDTGATWSAHDIGRRWVSVASSADGSMLVAAVSGGQIYTSIDSGATWTAHATVQPWVSVASSTDGTRLVAAVNGGKIYTSVDAGATWVAQATIQPWVAVASSADGSHLVAAINVGKLYTSADAGATWTARDSSRGWKAVASSADGSNLLAALASGAVYVSADAGVSWAPVGVSRTWTAVASSSDGHKVVGVVNGGQIYTAAQ
jgi:hypothetical protein